MGPYMEHSVAWEIKIIFVQAAKHKLEPVVNLFHKEAVSVVAVSEVD